MGALVDMTGKKFGRLTVLSRDGKDGFGRASWKCVCDCGNVVRVAGYQMRYSTTLSCGCLNREAIITHGRSRSKEYQAWHNMVQRCCNPKRKDFPIYGGRGIVVEPAWVHDFAAFHAHIGDAPSNRHTIERIENAGGYVAGNVRWATRAEQAINRSTNILVRWQGKMEVLTVACRSLGLSPESIRGKMRRGMSGEQALTDAIKTKKEARNGAI